MRKTKALIVYSVLQGLFTAVVPLVLLLCAYGSKPSGIGYKLPLGVILVGIVIIWIAKNTLLKPRIARLTANIAQHEADLKVEADPAKIRNLETELKAERTIETILNAIMPLFVLLGLLVLCKALENAAIVLSGAVGLTLGSFVVGQLFGVLAARQVVGKHRAKEKRNG